MSSRIRRHRLLADAEPPAAHLRILTIIQRIPRGCVLAYGDVARRARLPGRARLVGYVLRVSPLAGGVPWHRVVASGPRLALRDDHSMREQRLRLEAEGWTIGRGGRLTRTADLR